LLGGAGEPAKRFEDCETGWLAASWRLVNLLADLANQVNLELRF
jgi:hypothetical protein